MQRQGSIVSHDQLELYSWNSGWGLWSVDPFCLSIQAYCVLGEEERKRSRAEEGQGVVNPITYFECYNPDVSPNGALPLLLVGKREAITGTNPILSHLRSKRGGQMDLDAPLSHQQRATSDAYISLIQDTLQDALLHTQWMDEENYLHSTKPRISRSLSMLSRYYIPIKLRGKAMIRLKHYGLVPEHTVISSVDGIKAPSSKSAQLDAKGHKMVSEVYLVAKRGYAALDQLLGDTDYFFDGDFPTTLDAFAYGHLSLHAIPSLSNPVLFSMLSFQFPRLLAFVHRMQSILDRCAPASLVELSKPKPVRSWKDVFFDAFPVHLLFVPEDGDGYTEGSTNTSGSWRLMTPDQRRREFYKWSSIAVALSFFGMFAIKKGGF